MQRLPGKSAGLLSTDAFWPYLRISVDFLIRCRHAAALMPKMNAIAVYGGVQPPQLRAGGTQATAMLHFLDGVVLNDARLQFGVQNENCIDVHFATFV
eukprot:6094152-Pleurochrysis_carterae.AAC.1